MADLSDKICLVTGATQGIGYETAAGLAGQGATTILVGRDAPRTADAVKEIKNRTGNEKVEYLVADLSDFDQIRDLAVRFKERHDRLDVLVNNAGGMRSKRTVLPGDFEFCWKLNHLGYFLLTAEFMESLKAAETARIVNVASDAHYGGKIDFDDLQGENHFSAWKAYSQSKLANVMFTYALARRLAGSGITANCLHPGVVGSNFFAAIGPLAALVAPIGKLFMISTEKGARTSIYLASSPEVAGVSGKYFDKCRPERSSDASYDEDAQERLWTLSVAQTGAAYSF